MTRSDLDIEQPDMLLAYLRGTRRIGLDERVEIHRLSGGVSNRTVLVRRPDGQAWVIKQALNRLRVQTEWRSDPRRVHREAAGLRWLTQIAPHAVAPLAFEDFDHHLFAMAAVPQPYLDFKNELMAGRVESRYVEQFAALLACVHRCGSQQADSAAEEFADRGFFESLRIEPYYNYSAGGCPQAAMFLGALVADCRARRYTVVHGDYSPKNILVHDNRLILLDHEVIHFGDGAFDVGFAMTHLLSKAHHLTDHRPAFAAAARQFWQVYRDGIAAIADPDLESTAVRHTLACLLARVVGRSPLEYLVPQERGRQADVVVEIMLRPPATMPALIEAFIERL